MSGLLFGDRVPAIRGWVVLSWVVFIAVCSLLAVWAREQPLVSPGRVMNTTATVRVPFEVKDIAATEEAQRAERQRTPRVYVAETAAFDEIRMSLRNLPKTLAAAERLERVDPGIRRQFGLTEEGLGAVRGEVVEGEPSEAWVSRVDRLISRLELRPIIDGQAWQRETQAFSRQVELLIGDRRVFVPMNDVLNVEDGQRLEEVAERLVREAGFGGAAAEVAAARLTRSPKPTYRFDAGITAERQAAAAARVEPVIRQRPQGHVIFTRGEKLTQEAYELYVAEMAHFRRHAEAWRVWLRWLSIAAAVTAITGALAGYASLFCRRVARKPGRTAGVAGLLAGALALACWGTVMNPALLTLTAVAPTVFVAVLLVIGYDQRVAMAFGGLHGVLVCVALNQPIGIFALMLTGVGVAVWQLHEVRERKALIQLAFTTAAALAAATMLVALIDRPINEMAVRQAIGDAALAGFGGFMVGVLALFVLPLIERMFNVTTAMTLIELRDPKNPLLRQLQQRAPGTYNHSLNVASLCEAAASEIGADSLLTYVGALYHDVGKMNKPDYFVENQPPGFNRHDKLSPAMSLLVIVGHVKDGMELAREYGLPRTLHHFIEAHHGTTLVEYFFRRARQQAESESGDGRGGGSAPDEVEYRYPGPKPRTKEVAILLLCDAVESAARAMADPTPSRIDAMVRAMANKRLIDGQFDECDLTLRELNAVVETVSRTLASIYHGRIAYPGGDEGRPSGSESRSRSVDGDGTRVQTDSAESVA